MGRALNVGYPRDATPLSAGSGNVADAAAVATLAKADEEVVYITGFQVTGAGATAGANVAVTVAGIIGGTRTFIYSAAAGAAVANQPLVVTFDPPLPASGENVDIVVTCPALGTGNTHNAVTAQGFRI